MFQSGENRLFSRGIQQQLRQRIVWKNALRGTLRISPPPPSGDSKRYNYNEGHIPMRPGSDSSRDFVNQLQVLHCNDICLQNVVLVWVYIEVGKNETVGRTSARPCLRPITGTSAVAPHFQLILKPFLSVGCFLSMTFL